MSLMPAATAAGTRPRSTRGGSSRSNLAYDLGRRGEEIPAWAREHHEHREHYHRGVADRDRALAGNTSPPDDDDVDDPTDLPVAPQRGTPAPSSSGRSWRPSLPSVPVPDTVGSAAAGALAYVLFLNFIRGGAPQVRRWFAAKFTNGAGRLP